MANIKSTRSPKTTVAAQRTKEALALRSEGLGFEEIGARLGITRQGAVKAYDRAMAELKADTEDLAQHNLELELLRLDDMLKAIMPLATAGELPHIATALKIAEQRAKLLGLYAPTKSELTGKNGQPLIHTELSQEQVRRMAQEVLNATSTEPVNK